MADSKDKKDAQPADLGTPLKIPIMDGNIGDAGDPSAKKGTTPDSGTPKPTKAELDAKAKANLPSDADRLKESAKEALRLKNELDAKNASLAEKEGKLKRMEQYESFIKRLEVDPEYARFNLDYIDGKFKPQQTAQAPANNPFDDTFDPDELSDPNSKSSQMLAKAVEARAANIAEKTVTEALSQYDSKRRSADSKKDLRQAYLRKHPDKTEADIDALEAQAKALNWDYELLDKVLNLDTNGAAIDAQARKDVQAQMNAVNGIPSTMAASASDTSEPGFADKLFSEMKRVIDDENVLG